MQVTSEMVHKYTDRAGDLHGHGAAWDLSAVSRERIFGSAVDFRHGRSGFRTRASSPIQELRTDDGGPPSEKYNVVISREISGT